MRSNKILCALLLAAQPSVVRGQTDPAPLSLLDVPFLSQSEALCGGAAAAMVMRYWGEREVSAESFAHLVDAGAAGIRTDALVNDLRQRGWDAFAAAGRPDLLRGELERGRPVVTLIEDRPHTYHYVVIVGWHERGVVLHDPARAPYRVMSRGEFERRWNASRRWMAVVVPRTSDASTTGKPTGLAAQANRGSQANGRPPANAGQLTPCDALIGQGVRAAEANDIDAAERSLASALSCPGSAPLRELAGVRLLQKRWGEVSDLAASAVAVDARDEYAWKLLGTARFIQDDASGALDAWNRAGEPRIDVVRVDGLARTRHRVVERLLGVDAGTMLTDRLLARTRRRFAELPAAVSTRLEYAPVRSGLAEVRGSVLEQALLPMSPISLGMMGLSAAATREVRLTFGSFTGGGEQTRVAWRFWEHRPRVAFGIRAPAARGGVWGVDAFQERQSFTAPGPGAATRRGMRLTQSNWATGHVRWNVDGGIDRWNGLGQFGVLGGGVRLASRRDRIDTGLQLATWLGREQFLTSTASVLVRSSSEPRGFVLLATGATHLATESTPLDLWPAGDTGSARSTLLRAHPILSHGRLRVDRLGRRLQAATGEAQRWWRVAGPVRAAAAAFIDVGKVTNPSTGGRRTDIDAGVGARFSTATLPGTFRIDLAHGLRDGQTALSFVYEP